MSGSVNDDLVILEIKELNSKHFLIEAYQRGYRWTKQQVIDLCNDINNYGKNYCLQQLVVQEKKVYEVIDGQLQEKKVYEVIDGQQRLTTLSIIKAALDDKERPIIKYATREKSEDFLNNIRINIKEQAKNVDEYHMIEAYNACNEWLKGTDLAIFSSALRNCFFIWYKIKNNDDPYAVFTRLNMGKISLTDTELIKAVLLNINKCENALQQKERSIEWDEIMRMFERNEFWYYICPKTELKEYELCRSDYLFHLISKKEKDKKNPYSLFKWIYNEVAKREVESIWNNEIRVYYNHLKFCFEDKELYHLIGYANACNICSITYLIGNKDLVKYSDWKKELKKLIKINIINSINSRIENAEQKLNIDNSPEEMQEALKKHCNEKLSYCAKDNSEISKLLLLFNIITLQNDKSADSRYPFHEHSKYNWSLEHIHARNEAIDSCNWDEYCKAAKSFVEENQCIDRMRNILSKDEGDNKVFSIEVLNEWNTLKDYDSKFNKFIEILSREKKEMIFDLFESDSFNYDTSMGNLALLPKNTNSELNNSAFKKKKEKIAKCGDQNMIPICTRNAFFKIYSPKDDISVIWHYKNAEDYINTLTCTIINYLK